MKVKNGKIVNFLNNAGKTMQKKIPNRLCFAVDVNIGALQAAGVAYNKRYEEIVKEKDTEKRTSELEELLNIQVEVPIQTVPLELLEQMDESLKFDALTGEEYAAIQFMIER